MPPGKKRAAVSAPHPPPQPTMTAAALGLPRVPPAHDGMQFNFCKTPTCVNYGVPVPLAVNTGRGAKNPYTSGGTPQVPGATCTACGTYFPFKSNEGIVQERNRLRLPPVPPLPSCLKSGCANAGIPVDTPGAYQGYGRTKAGTPRWKCNACGASFSRSLKPTLFHDLASKNRMIFKLLSNKVPLRRIAAIEEIGQGTVHHRLAFLADQCAAFMADRERRLAGMEIPRLYLSVDRQDYTLNWITRRTRRNITLSAAASVDNRTGYCFGLHLNYDGTIVPSDAEADAVAIHDAVRPPPWRKYARIWLRNDYAAAAVRAYRKQARGATLDNFIDDGYLIAGARADIESPDAPDLSVETLPQDGVQTRLEYTLYGHFLHLRELCPNVGKWRFALDQDSGMRAACLGV